LTFSKKDGVVRTPGAYLLPCSLNDVWQHSVVLGGSKPLYPTSAPKADALPDLRDFSILWDNGHMGERLHTDTDHGSPQQRAEAQCLRLEQCLKNHPGGGSDPDALHEMQALGRDLKRVSYEVAEKVGNLLESAAVLYSPRRHTRKGNFYQSGAEVIAHRMRCDLVSIKTLLWRMPPTG
jgi:hypothetical protein